MYVNYFGNIFSDCSTELYRKSDGTRVCAILLGEKLAYADAVGTCKSMNSTLMPITDDITQAYAGSGVLHVVIVSTRNNERRPTATAADVLHWSVCESNQ